MGFKMILFLVFLSALVSGYVKIDAQNRQLTPGETSILRDRLNGADYVVKAKVVNIERVGTSRSISEHNPDWQRATLKVGSVLFAKRSIVFFDGKNEINIYFPASNDVAWTEWPKFRKGQKGIWILYYTKNQALKDINLNAKVASKEFDYQPITLEKEVRKLLKK